MESERISDFSNQKQTAQIAELSDACCEKLREYEREINKMGYWNIALVAYQMKE